MSLRRTEPRPAEDLDPERDWHEIFKRLILLELPAEARVGFQLAFYRPFAVPRMANVLQTTGHMQFDTTRRAYDTALVIYEIIYGGVDSDRGSKMVRLMNRLHDRPDIHTEDLTYLLSALNVVPTRFMNRFGWRTVTETERQATWRFWDELGQRMKIQTRPSSYADAEKRVADYESTNIAPSEAGAALTRAAVEALRNRMPRPARPFAPQITSVLVGDPAVSQALALPDVNRGLSVLVKSGAGVRRMVKRRQGPAEESWFTPGRGGRRAYPNGYDIDKLGPRGT